MGSTITPRPICGFHYYSRRLHCGLQCSAAFPHDCPSRQQQPSGRHSPVHSLNWRQAMLWSTMTLVQFEYVPQRLQCHGWPTQMRQSGLLGILACPTPQRGSTYDLPRYSYNLTSYHFGWCGKVVSEYWLSCLAKGSSQSPGSSQKTLPLWCFIQRKVEISSIKVVPAWKWSQNIGCPVLLHVPKNVPPSCQGLQSSFYYTKLEWQVVYCCLQNQLT